MPTSSIEFIAHRGCFDIDLRCTCIALGGGLLCLLGIEAILSPRVVQRTDAFVDWTICFVCNVMLLIGVAMRNKWIAVFWLISPLVVFIGAPATEITLRYLEQSNYNDDRYLLFCEFMLHICVYFITGRYVISYIIELWHAEKAAKQRQRIIDTFMGSTSKDPKNMGERTTMGPNAIRRTT